MPLNTAAVQIGSAAIAAAITHVAIHTAQPDASGSNQSAAARVAAAATSTAGVISVGAKAFTGGAANGPATHVGYWTALTAGTFLGWRALTGDQTFNAAGQYNLTGATETGSST